MEYSSAESSSASVIECVSAFLIRFKATAATGFGIGIGDSVVFIEFRVVEGKIHGGRRQE